MRQLPLTPILVLAVALAVAGGAVAASRSDGVAARAASCPKAWADGWQRLANRARAPVYCPTWMPPPLDARIGGPWFNGESLARDRSYLVSFVWQETSPSSSTEVHVNFRGYPGRTAIPICEDTLTVGGRTVRKRIPCFSDARGTRRIAGITATMYTVNQGADQWHVLYAWRRAGSLYTISEHVAPPFTFARVVRNLDRMLRGLVLVRPSL